MRSPHRTALKGQFVTDGASWSYWSVLEGAELDLQHGWQLSYHPPVLHPHRWVQGAGSPHHSVPRLLVLGRDAACPVDHNQEFGWCHHRAELCVFRWTPGWSWPSPSPFHSPSWADGPLLPAPALPAGGQISPLWGSSTQFTGLQRLIAYSTRQIYYFALKYLSCEAQS